MNSCQTSLSSWPEENVRKNKGIWCGTTSTGNNAKVAKDRGDVLLRDLSTRGSGRFWGDCQPTEKHSERKKTDSKPQADESAQSIRPEIVEPVPPVQHKNNGYPMVATLAHLSVG